MNAYLIAWTWKAQRYVLDVNTAGIAGVVGVILAETGREDVEVQEMPYEPDTEQQAVWERIQQRIREPLGAMGT